MNPATDKLFNAYADRRHRRPQVLADQADPAGDAEDVPVIPVTECVDWFQYNTGHFSGWPTSGNPYAQPAAFAYPTSSRSCCTCTSKTRK